MSWGFSCTSSCVKLMKQEIGLRTLIALKTKQSCLNHVISRWLEKTFKQRHLCKTAHIATILVIATTELSSLIHCIPTFVLLPVSISNDEWSLHFCVLLLRQSGVVGWTDRNCRRNLSDGKSSEYTSSRTPCLPRKFWQEEIQRHDTPLSRVPPRGACSVETSQLQLDIGFNIFGAV